MIQHEELFAVIDNSEKVEKYTQIHFYTYYNNGVYTATAQPERVDGVFVSTAIFDGQTIFLMILPEGTRRTKKTDAESRAKAEEIKQKMLATVCTKNKLTLQAQTLLKGDIK